MRDTFDKNLPHPSTIRQWYRNCDLDATSGFTQFSLGLIKQKAKEMEKNKNEQLLVSIVMDEMNIMRDMLWCRSTNKFIGTIDLGVPKTKEEFDLATNVIVVMAVGLYADFQQPIGYYFIQTLKSHERASLTNQVLEELSTGGKYHF